jgi:hypothetical protein
MKRSHIAGFIFAVVSLALAVAPLKCFGDEGKVESNGKYKKPRAYRRRAEGDFEAA